MIHQRKQGSGTISLLRAGGIGVVLGLFLGVFLVFIYVRSEITATARSVVVGTDSVEIERSSMHSTAEQRIDVVVETIIEQLENELTPSENCSDFVEVPVVETESMHTNVVQPISNSSNEVVHREIMSDRAIAVIRNLRSAIRQFIAFFVTSLRSIFRMQVR